MDSKDKSDGQEPKPMDTSFQSTRNSEGSSNVGLTAGAERDGMIFSY